MRKPIFIFTTAVIALFAIPSIVKAACPLPATTNITFQSGDTCTISSFTGVDSATTEASTTNAGKITLPTGSSITINATSSAILSAGSISLTGGSISLQSAPLPANRGKILSGGVMYGTDTDGDGWLDNLTFYTSTAAGRRRLTFMHSLTQADCNSSSFSLNNVCCRTDGNSCSADGDCCSSVCGTDADSDGYFSQASGHTGACSATSKPYTDCYDVNSTGGTNTNPGQAAYFTTNRGDGSFDYNCNGSQEKNATDYGSICSQGPCQYTTQNLVTGAGYVTPGCGANFNDQMLNEPYTGNACYTATCATMLTTYTRTVGCR